MLSIKQKINFYHGGDGSVGGGGISLGPVVGGGGFENSGDGAVGGGGLKSGPEVGGGGGGDGTQSGGGICFNKKICSETVAGPLIGGDGSGGGLSIVLSGQESGSGIDKRGGQSSGGGIYSRFGGQDSGGGFEKNGGQDTGGGIDNFLKDIILKLGGDGGVGGGSISLVVNRAAGVIKLLLDSLMNTKSFVKKISYGGDMGGGISFSGGGSESGGGISHKHEFDSNAIFSNHFNNGGEGTTGGGSSSGGGISLGGDGSDSGGSISILEASFKIA